MLFLWVCFTVLLLSFSLCTSSQRQPQTKKHRLQAVICYLIVLTSQYTEWHIIILHCQGSVQILWWYNRVRRANILQMEYNTTQYLCIVDHSEILSSSVFFFLNQRNKVTFYCNILLRPVLLKTFAKLLNEHLCLKCNHLCAEIL